VNYSQNRCVVCPQAAKASSDEKINRHICIEPPSPCSRKSSLYVDAVTNLLMPFLRRRCRAITYSDLVVLPDLVCNRSRRYIGVNETHGPFDRLHYIFWILGSSQFCSTWPRVE